MTDQERDNYIRILRRLRRLTAACEALSCGYGTADMAAVGDETEARTQFLHDLTQFAADAGLVTQPCGASPTKA